jgi:endonuclease YncB( thermonuclease family)
MKTLALILSFLLAMPALADTRVIGGDTIEMDGEKIRILGLSTPKTGQWQPKCLAEKMLGLRARAYAEELVLRIESIEEQSRDQYGQILARIGLNDGKCPPATDWCGK